MSPGSSDTPNFQAEIRIGDSPLMLDGVSPGFAECSARCRHVTDADALYKQALRAGELGPRSLPSGRRAIVRDRCGTWAGNPWMATCKG